MITTIAIILSIIGALNWLLVGVFGFNLVAFLFGTGTIAVITYIVIGLAGLWLVYFLVKNKMRVEHMAESTRYQ